MRPAPGMHVEWVESEAVVLDPETGELHHLNPTAAFVYALILEHGVPAAIEEVRRLKKGEATVEADLPQLLDEMVDKGLLIRD